MRYANLQKSVGSRPTVLTVGFFDGVHLGHLAVIDRVTAAARQRNARSVVVTFDPHPRTVLTEKSVALLSTQHEKVDLLSDAGIDLVVVLPFDRALSELTAREFVSDILVEQIGAIHMVVGYDHSLGKGAAGDPRTIGQIGEELGFTTEIVQAHSSEYGTLSSSLIREILHNEGDVRSAGAQLGRAYSLSGKVVHGDGRGKELGFPTANLDLGEQAKVVPANGVYAVRVSRDDEDSEHDGIMNIGVRPTLTSGSLRVLEVHLLEFNEDLYGEHLEVKFVDRIRNERKFDGVNALKRQIHEDIADCIRIHDGLS